jgi:hypothetical protein
MQNAHRAGWEIERGPVPDGLHVLHRCDNRLCCNLDHLFLGTHADNMADKVAKGRCASVTGDRHGSRVHPERRPRGESHGRAVLTAGDLAEVRRLRAAGATYKIIASKFSVNKSTVRRAIVGETWAGAAA